MTNFTSYTSKRTNKLIGLEIEFFGVHVHTVVNELNAAGIATTFEGYTHRVIQNAWKLVTDSSVTSTGTGVGGGLELVSPPLTMDAMDAQLQIITSVFERIGAKVNKSCGVHVHHEIDDLKTQDIKNLYAIYFKHHETINEIMPKSRRDAYYAKNITSTLLDRIQNATSIMDIRMAAHARYCVINFNSYVKYGTVEFRQHGGSFEHGKIMPWIRITQAMVHAATEKKTIKVTMGEKVNRTVAFNKEIGTYHTAEGVFVRDRKAALKKLYKAAAV